MGNKSHRNQHQQLLGPVNTGTHAPSPMPCAEMTITRHKVRIRSTSLSYHCQRFVSLVFHTLIPNIAFVLRSSETFYRNTIAFRPGWHSFAIIAFCCEWNAIVQSVDETFSQVFFFIVVASLFRRVFERILAVFTLGGSWRTLFFWFVITRIGHDLVNGIS